MFSTVICQGEKKDILNEVSGLTVQEQHSCTLFAIFPMETRRTGATPTDRVTRTSISTGAGLSAAVAIETREALFERETKPCACNK